MRNQEMTSNELKATWGLGVILSLRMFGMFMVLPVLTTYGMALEGASKSLIGLSIGAYGLTQAIFQIPLGLLSDRIGRKPVIIGGLIVFIIGSAVAALTDSIWGIIIGRILQGSGAISSSVMALLSDLVREQNRTKAIAFFGVIFASSFSISMTTGPIITQSFGLHALFWFALLLAIVCVFLTHWIIPNNKITDINCKQKSSRVGFNKALKNLSLLKLNFSIMCLHMLLMFIFIVLPRKMIFVGFSAPEHWKIYITTISFSFIFATPLIIYAETKCCMKRILFLSAILLLCSEVVLWTSGNNLIKLLIGIQLFFLAFSPAEGLLPSLVSKETLKNNKGAAMGVYSTSQFIGVAIGGSLGGWLDSFLGLQNVFFAGILITIIWLSIISTMKEPSYISEFQIVIPNDEQIIKSIKIYLEAKIGVNEVLVIPERHAAYVKVDRKVLDRHEIEKFLKKLTKIYTIT